MCICYTIDQLKNLTFLLLGQYKKTSICVKLEYHIYKCFSFTCINCYLTQKEHWFFKVWNLRLKFVSLGRWVCHISTVKLSIGQSKETSIWLTFSVPFYTVSLIYKQLLCFSYLITPEYSTLFKCFTE